MNRLILAFQFLTIFPIKKEIEINKGDLAASMAYFPFVGAVQGLILVLSYYVLAGLLPNSVTSGIIVLILTLTNGGLHLDGFADTVDGLAGGKNEEDRLRIMKDSSTGAIGVVFLIIVLLIKYITIEAMPETAKLPVLFSFPVVGRWSMVPLAKWSNAAKPHGLGASFAGNSTATFVKATIITGVICSVVLGLLSLAPVALIMGTAFYFSRFFKRKLGGITGDVFGFQSEIAEVGFLVSVLALIDLLAYAQ